MKNNKALIITVIALMVVNIGLLAFMWRQRFQHRPGGGPGPAYEFLTKELSLTPGQQAKYGDMRKVHLALTQRISRETHLLRDSFFAEVKNDPLDSTQLNSLEHKILNNQRRLDSATFYHFRQLRAILDDGQQEKFDKLLKNVLQMMASPAPHGPGPGRPDGEPGQQQGPPPPGPGGPPPGG